MSFHNSFYDSRAYDLPTQTDEGADGKRPQQQAWEPRGLTPLTIKQIMQAVPGQNGELIVRGRLIQQVNPHSINASHSLSQLVSLHPFNHSSLVDCPTIHFGCLAVDQVRVVGQYAEESRRGSHAYFFVNDSTGQLQCTCTLEGNDAMIRVFEQLQHTKSYLAVVGKVRPGGTMFVYYARLVTDFNQLTYHTIECIYENFKAKAPSQTEAAIQQPQQPQQLPGHRVYPDKQVTPVSIRPTTTRLLLTLSLIV